MLNPFKGIPNKSEVFAWGMYDLANQSFTLLIITLLFSRYVQQVVTLHPPEPEAAALVAGGAEPESLTADQQAELAAYEDAVTEADNRGKFNWSLMHGSTLLCVFALSPLLGAIGDAKGWRKRLLVVTGLLCSALTASLFFVGPGMIVVAALLYIPANFCFQIGENFLASFLPEVSTPRTLGKVSAIGWTMGYVGALALLVVSAGITQAAGLTEATDWPPLFVFAGAWFFFGMIPAVVVLRKDKAAESIRKRDVLGVAIGRVSDTFRHARRYRELVKFLIAFLVYGFGVQVIIGFASIIAKDFGIESTTQLIIFVAQITITAGISSWVTGLFQDKIGVRPTVLIYLVIWLVSSGALLGVTLGFPDGGPQWPIWVIGNGLGFALGGIGTSSRSMVARFTPAHRRAEFFGLWGMVYKLAGGLGVLAFGAIAEVFGNVASLGFLTGTFAFGLVLMLPVREVAGVCAARRAERAVGIGRRDMPTPCDEPASVGGSASAGGSTAIS